ncbi:Disulfide bond formation protein D [Pseudidiomarina piscicola]|uniref:Disulfide bond formation protein D n=1 Tax=Pseudidiomarina piscicola TaxID=2614830 RepID=A0A6S6WKQ7_9GAMM|nr:DsbA family protein [Pseudidiomarina piscicola]CAB0151367.1 Disulfide bond formation protein D [Pseudidiomarina piscicola]VZT40848.1 Disulfide bond formation protein D [Pseudomonas aeruginosa]
MLKTINSIKLIFVAMLLMLSQAANAQTITESQEQDLQAIERLLRDNPQMISNIRTSLENFMQQQKAQQQIFERYQAWLYESGEHPVIGDPDAEHSIVVFTDYNCPYCKKLEPSIEKIIADYPSIKFINVLLPLRQQRVAGISGNSILYGLNVWASSPDKYFDVHTMLMDRSSMHNADSLRSIARRTQTMGDLKATIGANNVVDKNLSAFRDLGFRGTPTIMVGDQWIPGFIEHDELEAVIKAEFF